MGDAMQEDPRPFAPQAQRMDTPMQDSANPFKYASAPLPSPTQQRPQFFSALSNPSVTSAPAQSPQTNNAPFPRPAKPQFQPGAWIQGGHASHQLGHAMAQQQHQQAPQQHHQQQQAHQHQQQYPPKYGNSCLPQSSGSGGTSAEMRGLVEKFGLVAEAAKRAQMAVLMRDMEGMEMA